MDTLESLMSASTDLITLGSLTNVRSSSLFEEYLKYMTDNEVSEFRVMSKEFVRGRSLNYPRQSTEQVRAQLPKLRSDNVNGRSVYIRPTGKQWVFLDIDQSGYADFDELPLLPEFPYTFAIETSNSSWQLWFYVVNVDTDDVQVAVVKFLARQYANRTDLRADPGAARANQIGRAPGFRNTKPGRDRFWVKFHYPEDYGRLNLYLPLDEIVFQFGELPPPGKRKAPEPKPAPGSGDRSGSGADFGRCMMLLRKHEGDVSIPAMTSTLRNFSSHEPKDGKTKEEYYMLTVANARLRWAFDFQNIVRERFGGRFECVMDPVPAGYKYAGGQPKPRVVQFE